VRYAVKRVGRSPPRSSDRPGRRHDDAKHRSERDAVPPPVGMLTVEASDALLLGRTTYDIFRDYWPGKTDEIGRAFDRVPKYVASRGRPELSWDDSTQITGSSELRVGPGATRRVADCSW
jgi:hypothetical protein